MLNHGFSDSRHGSQQLSLSNFSAVDLDQLEAAGDVRANGEAVGLLESKYSTKQRRLLDLMNKLHSTGCVIYSRSAYCGLTVLDYSIQSEIDLPQICVIGSQSAGKSSLIKSISGVSIFQITSQTELRINHSRYWADYSPTVGGNMY